MISGIGPWDELEEQHQLDTLRWLESTDDVFRRAKPATPDRHLVSYVVLVDADGSALLVDHINMRDCGCHPAGTLTRTSTPPTRRGGRPRRS